MPSATHRKIAPEMRLLICCARTRISRELSGEVRVLLAETLDWDGLISAAEVHSLTPLLERNLRAVAPGLVPPAHLERLTAINRENAFHSLTLIAELVKIAGALEPRQIVSLPYKGPAAAVQAYGDVSLRNFEDVDLLVPQRQIGEVNEIMLELGYEPSLAWLASPKASASVIPGEYKYYRQDCDAIVEFHTERTLRHFPVAPDLDDFAHCGVRVALSGREILTLRPEDALVSLCVHGCKDFWARLIWVADISELMQAQAIDWDRAFGRAESLRAQRMVRVGLLLAKGILEAPIPHEIGAVASGDRVARLLAQQIADQLLLEGSELLSTAARFAFRRHSVPGALAGWRYALRLTMAPAQDDVQMVQLPRALQPFYMLLRPLRLLHKYREN